MCGIVGYVGRRRAVPIVLQGLKRLEYRGYDSAGIASLEEGRLFIQKSKGKVSELETLCLKVETTGTVGMGHTRWATHGEPSVINAHPHTDCSSRIAVIHNGIIENYSTLKTTLESKGHMFCSSTDTEILAHLIEEYYMKTGDLDEAFRSSLRDVVGTYGIIVMSDYEPEKLLVARKGSPLLIGVGKGEAIVASDASAIIQHTRDVMYLNDEEMAVVSTDGVVVKTLDDREIAKDIDEVTYELDEIEKGHYRHFMAKEINEQPESVLNAMRGRIIEEEGTAKLGGLEELLPRIEKARRLIFTACGTSWHSAMAGKYMLEQYAGKTVSVEYASEFRYGHSPLGKDDVVFCISQSGETADTLAALREAKAKGATVVGICNVVGSSIARESDCGVYTHAGPEIGVASTKAFTSQLVVLALITLLLARRNGMSIEEGRRIIRELKTLPGKIGEILSNTRQIEYIAYEFHDHEHFMYLGRGFNFPVALEGALKLKEISYIHAEGYPAAEMKHGPIALIDENMPAVFIAPDDLTYDKIISNIQEIKARSGKVIAVLNKIDGTILRLVDHYITVPTTHDMLTPILTVIPLQLLAYFTAVLRGCDVDQPRNLAKSVTVE